MSHKIRYLKQETDHGELRAALGANVKSITSGNIQIGTEMIPDDDGIMVEMPVNRKGVEVEFHNTPTSSDIKAYDRVMEQIGHTREDKGIDADRQTGDELIEEIAALKVRFSALEAKVR